MSVSLKKLWNDYGVVGVLIAIIVLYGLYMLYKNLLSKGSTGSELMSQNRPRAYNNSAPSGPQPAGHVGHRHPGPGQERRPAEARPGGDPDHHRRQAGSPALLRPGLQRLHHQAGRL